MAEPAKRSLTYAEYLDLERAEDVRHEFLDGVAVAMSGGTPRHAKVKINVAAVFVNALGTGPCQPYDSDLKVRVLDTGLATYPDLAVVCGTLERHPEDKNAVTNPSLLVEVLSPSTQAWDRGDKFMHYRRIASLLDVVFVDPDALRVEHYHREADGSWRYREQVAEGSLEVLGVKCSIASFFLNLPDEPAPEPLAR
jgi:Uma2 family endonuclease